MNPRGTRDLGWQLSLFQNVAGPTFLFIHSFLVRNYNLNGILDRKLSFYRDIAADMAV